MDETRALAEELDITLKAARDLGKKYGRNAGSWIVDGNTSEPDLRAVIDMIEDGDPAFEIDGPFSGQWADGLTLGWFADELGVDEESDEFGDLCTAFEDEYYQAYQDEALRSARAMLPDDHPAEPANYLMAGAVFGACKYCSTPVWREDHPGAGYDRLNQGTWEHVETPEALVLAEAERVASDAAIGRCSHGALFGFCTLGC